MSWMKWRLLNAAKDVGTDEVTGVVPDFLQALSLSDKELTM